MYSNGLGVEQNYLKAYLLYKKACDMGNARGCYYLGNLYEKVSRDFEKAVFYYQKACNMGNKKACQKL